jgi:hypothetical protein
MEILALIAAHLKLRRGKSASPCLYDPNSYSDCMNIVGHGKKHKVPPSYSRAEKTRVR